MTDTTADRATAWTRYWRGGALTSCAGSYEGVYGQKIADFWRQGFTALGHEARVLDIGTGNGPLPRILLGLESRQDIQCDAVDLAQVSPPWVAELPPAARSRLRFHSGCRAEQLPFADASFDLIVSQWGLEYSDLQRSIPEILRVLKPGGAVQLILHHGEAVPVRLAKEEISHLQWLLAPASFLEASRSMLAPMSLAGTPQGRMQLAQSESATRLRQAFNVQQDALQERLSGGVCVDVLHDARRVVADLLPLAAREGLPKATAVFDQLQQSLQDSLLQLQELRNYALSRDAAQVLADALSAGQPYQLGELHDGQHLMGWTYRLNPA